MLFRAMFWVTMVAVFTPHEPDLGLGRPVSSSAALVAQTREALTGGAASLARSNCGEPSAACAASAGFLDSFKFAATRSLAEVKAEMEQAPRADSSD